MQNQISITYHESKEPCECWYLSRFINPKRHHAPKCIGNQNIETANKITIEIGNISNSEKNEFKYLLRAKLCLLKSRLSSEISKSWRSYRLDTEIRTEYPCLCMQKKMIFSGLKYPCIYIFFFGRTVSHKFVAKQCFSLEGFKFHQTYYYELFNVSLLYRQT